MKKCFALLLTMVLLQTSLAGCAQTSSVVEKNAGTRKVIGLTGRVDKDILMKRMGFEPEAAKLKSIGFYAGSYYAVFGTNLYKSDDLKSWSVVRERFDGRLAGDDKHVCIFRKNEANISHDGERWETYRFEENLSIKKIVSKNGAILVSTGNLETVVKKDDLEIRVIKSHSRYGSNGVDLIGKIESAGGRKKTLHILMDNGEWFDTKTEMIRSLWSFGNEFKILPHNQIFENDYTIRGNRLYEIFRKENGEYEVTRIKKSDQESTYDRVKNVFSKRLKFEKYRKGSFSSEMLLYDNYIEFDPNYLVANNRIFYKGRGGVVYSAPLDDLGSWQWCGLYKKPRLDINSMTDEKLDELGLVKHSGVYMFYDGAQDSYEYSRDKWLFFTSNDGINWNINNLGKDTGRKNSFSYGQEPENPYIEKDVVVVNVFSLAIKIYYEVKDEELVLKEVFLDHQLHVPPTEEEMQYLGMNGGSLPVSVVEKSKPLELLRLEEGFPKIKKLAYFNNNYYAFAKEQVFKSNDLKSWVEVSWNYPENIKKHIDINDKEQYISIHKNGILATRDGENWGSIYEGRLKLKKMRDYCMANGIICVIDESITERVVEELDGGLSFIRLPRDTYAQLTSDGTAFITNFRKSPKNTRVSDPIYISNDGISWEETDIPSIYRNGYFGAGTYKMLNYKGNRYVMVYYYDCSDNVSIYELIEENDTYRNRKILESMDNLNAKVNKVKDPTDRFACICFGEYLEDDSLGSGELIIDFKRLKFSYSEILVDSFCSDYAVKYCNDFLFKAGKYGCIKKLDVSNEWEWVGLYPRTPLTNADLEDPYIGGALGVRKVKDTYWFADCLDYSRYNVFLSKDGKVWDYQYRRYKRVKVK